MFISMYLSIYMYVYIHRFQVTYTLLIELVAQLGLSWNEATYIHLYISVYPSIDR